MSIFKKHNINTDKRQIEHDQMNSDLLTNLGYELLMLNIIYGIAQIIDHLNLCRGPYKPLIRKVSFYKNINQSPR